MMWFVASCLFNLIIMDIQTLKTVFLFCQHESMNIYYWCTITTLISYWYNLLRIEFWHSLIIYKSNKIIQDWLWPKKYVRIYTLTILMMNYTWYTLSSVVLRWYQWNVKQISLWKPISFVHKESNKKAN